MAISDSFEFANAIFTDGEFSYVRQKTVKDLGLQSSDGIIQVRWKEPPSALNSDHTARATVLIPVSEEEAARVEMKVDILFGKHYREDRDVQLRAVCASMGIQSAPSPCEVQPDDSCAGSVAEAASPPMLALDLLTHSPTILAVGPDAGLQIADCLTRMEYNYARRSGAVGRQVHAPSSGGIGLHKITKDRGGNKMGSTGVRSRGTFG